MKTNGPLRGFISRWLMRFEATRGMLQLVGIGVTAASTLTSALVAVGYSHLAPYVLGAGLIAAPAYAWAYVELGIFNRKNRERMDRGDNFSGPGMYMGNSIQAQAFARALEAVNDGEDPTEAAEEAVRERWRDFRNGIDVTEFDNEHHA